MVFYRKYRPQKFSDIEGQKHVVETLLSQLEKGKISHGYLFSGPKGTGKTTTARIFAKAVNCEVYKKGQKFGEPCNKCLSCVAVFDSSHLDLVEIDAASNRNIDDVRDLREKIRLSPVSGRFKVYIIDEVHMLTREAFNALLKTLEEPPQHAIFILCTTDIGKLPQTIISRVQRFNFKRANLGELSQAVLKIAKREGIKIDKEAIGAVAQTADGSFRDAVSILDQVSSAKGQITKADILSSVILIGWEQTYDFAEKVIGNDLKGAILAVNKLVGDGADISSFTKEVIMLFEKLLFLKIGILKQDLDLEDVQLEKLENLSGQITTTEVQNLMKILITSEVESKLYPLPQIPLVLALCKYCLPKGKVNLSEPSGSSASESTTEVLQSEVVKTQPTQKETKVINQFKGKPGKSLAQIEAKWGDFLNKVRPVNTHIMAILRSTRPISLNNGTLTLEAFYRFHKEKLEEPKVAKMLQDLLSEVTGNTIILKFVLASRDTKPPMPVAKSDVVDVDSVNFEKLQAEIGEIFSK